MAETEENTCVNIHRDLMFKDLRNYLSIMTRLSICMLETLNYNNYIRLKDVPHSYDDYYVYGIDMIESEFYQINEYEYAADGEPKNLTFASCIEVMLSEKPKGAQNPSEARKRKSAPDCFRIGHAREEPQEEPEES